MTNRYRDQLNDLEDLGRLRVLRTLSDRRGCRVRYKGQELLNLSSNDYLGLAGDHDLLHRFYADLDSAGQELIEQYGLGATASRLLGGDCMMAQDLELDLAVAYAKEAALLFNSGYHANIGILPALYGRGDLILSDKLNHASIHDGLRLSRAEYKRFNHGDHEQLRALLVKARGRYQRVVIVSESVFSMDGDVADIRGLVALKQEFSADLYLDEAHALGLYGGQGLGQAEAQGVLDEVDLLVGTFGKAMASMGAYVVCRREIRDYLINHSRSLIFTTALPPVILHWNRFVFHHQLSLAPQRKWLQDLSDRFRNELSALNIPTAGSTNIIPVLIGRDAEAVRLAELMREKGFLVLPVRPPAVPEGTARFRLSLTADMQWSDLVPFLDVLVHELDVITGATHAQ
ncbi:MAG: 8-amino-7-oxononanoate synthase [Desulfobulbaceae bacterium]|uniref:8-amino-7-oxononanoate synthase n=1 Tax=Candidatus Desulfatifera sulfidica TaxID=2841691 RepID=A0A8J6NC15_9BACT|nr:8-amino-7-oxononanoate synthase [Candidatus Desulfatifera sulfidica]